MRNILFLSGIFSPLVYVIMTILGGVMRPDYSHIYHSVSELLEVGAPNKLMLDSLLSLSGILSIMFGVGVLILVQESNQKRKAGLFAAVCLITTGALVLLTAIFFPMDPRHTNITFPGLMHLVLVGVMSILSVVATFLMANWLTKQRDYVGYGTYSYISAVVIFVTGGCAALWM